ncbi:MAG: hypothetical protein IJ600_12975 [Lachnospiraceae bacterium]|nr:hypothetical protein [Lachnospiraceae bacterium]
MAEQTILRVSTEELTKTVGNFNGNLSTVTNLTSSMLQLIQGLGSVINGEGYDNFRTKAEGLSNDMDQVKKMIEGHMREIEQVKTIMDGLIADNNNVVNGLPADAIS